MSISQALPTSRYSKEKIEIKCDVCNETFFRRYDCHCESSKLHTKDLCKKCSCKRSGQNRIGKYFLTEEQTKSGALKRIETNKTKYPKITKGCEYCHENFTINYARRDKAKYCSRKCQFAGNPKNRAIKDSRKTQQCLICKKEFRSYANHITCGRDCFSEYMAQTRLAENNPNWISRENLEKSRCPACNTIFSYSRKNLHKGQKRLFCSLICSKKMGSGKHIPSDIKEKYYLATGSPTENIEYNSNPYPRAWNEKLKSEIRKRDNNCCQLCESKNKLEIHHKDDDKENCDPSNLITLCRKCHNITKHNRPFWQQLFVGLDSNSKIVKKDWGLEIHFVNNEKYCLKYLVFFKDRQFSLHAHNLKQELFFCNWGQFECYLKDGEREDYFIFKKGDKLEIMPGVEHQLQALTNCILTEVSTTDYPEDSIRLIPGIN